MKIFSYTAIFLITSCMLAACATTSTDQTPALHELQTQKPLPSGGHDAALSAAKMF